MRTLAPMIKLLSIILLLFSFTWIVPIGVSYCFNEPHQAFLWAGGITFALSLTLYCLTHRTCARLKRNDGFIIVAAAWILLSLCSAIPFWLIDLPISNIDGLFEAVSGFTTTGAEAMTNIDLWPKSLQFYHQWLQFLGGLGIIILGMALIPILQDTGSEWLLSEISSSNHQSRITPMLHHTARALWGLYAGFTLLCILGYKIAGMPWFEAICYSFSTVSTGGFGIHNANLGHYALPLVPYVASFFMLLGSINFALHYRAVHYRSLRAYWQSQELRLYLLFLLLVFWVHMAFLAWNNDVPYIHMAFSTLAMMSTTGLQITDFATWPHALPYLLMIAAIMGGCCGSTSGGLKVARVWVLIQEARRSLFALTHPNAITSLHLEGISLSETHLQAIRGFLALFIMTFTFLLLAFMSTGYDLATAFAAIAACLCNVGLTIKPLADGYGQLATSAKGILIFTMIAGRLEILTLFILFTPSFWTDKAL